MPSIPSPDFGMASVERGTTLPFGATAEPEATVVLHVKVLSRDPVERLAVARLLTQQFSEQRIGAKGLSFIVTDEAVDVMLSDTSALAARITADVMSRLGLNK
jgi:hypothetical protein